MRRITAGLIAFLAVTSGLLVLPVYAAPGPEPHAVPASIEEVVLGSVAGPVGDAVVTEDGEPVSGAGDVGEPPAPSPAPEVPDVPAGSGAPDAGATTSGSADEGASTGAAPSAAPSDPAGEEGTEGAEPSPGESPAPAGPSATDVPAPAGPSSTDAPAPAGPGTQDEDVATSGDELPGVPALTVSMPDTGPFSTVGVTWRQGGETDVVTQIRVKRASGSWGEWTTLQPDDIEQTASAATDAAAVRGGTAPYWTDEASGIEVIVQGAGGVVPADVRVALVDPGESPADGLSAAATPTDEAHAGAVQPGIISRAQWGADESIRSWRPEYAPTIKAATLHHTADRNTYTAGDVPGMMRSIYAYHSVTRGWGDIGYNVIVDKFGRIFEGRSGGLSSTVIGAHAGGFNTGTFGVSMLGDYSSVTPSQATLDSVAGVIAWKLSLYGVNPHGTTRLTSGGGGTAKYAAGTAVTLPTIMAHRDVGNTSCPGQSAYNRMGQLRDMVAARMAPVAGSPIGNVDTLSVTGDRLDVAGWTYDQDQPSASIDVGVSIDGGWAMSLRADGNRPDIGAAFPAAGSAHGFSGRTHLSLGEHNVCVVAVNSGSQGANTWMRCQVVTATDGAVLMNPVGNVEAVTASGIAFTASGWTVDPDALSTPLDVHVYVNGRYHSAVTADQDRPDIANAFPGAGAAHGFSVTANLTTPGRSTVCVYAINRNVGTKNPLLNCGDVLVPSAAFEPRGRVDSFTRTGRGVQMSGWALDVDAPSQSLAIHVSVDRGFRPAGTADLSRPDVAAAFPGYGDRHGFSVTVDLPPGLHGVCAYAINVGTGAINTELGCTLLHVEASGWEPVGNLDSVVAQGDQVTAAGWVWDPDAGPSSTAVHLYVDGAYMQALPAADSRPDIAAAFPAAGAGHGFRTTLTLRSGRHTVCLYGINVGMGGQNPLLACRPVTVA